MVSSSLHFMRNFFPSLSFRMTSCSRAKTSPALLKGRKSERECGHITPKCFCQSLVKSKAHHTSRSRRPPVTRAPLSVPRCYFPHARAVSSRLRCAELDQCPPPPPLSSLRSRVSGRLRWRTNTRIRQSQSQTRKLKLRERTIISWLQPRAHSLPPSLPA